MLRGSVRRKGFIRKVQGGVSRDEILEGLLILL
jgi:hypothetical protein